MNDKYNGMQKAADWNGKRVRAVRQIRNVGGQGVTPGCGMEVKVGDMSCPRCGSFDVGNLPSHGVNEVDRYKAVIKILEANIKEQEALLKPMAEALREAVELLPRSSTIFMRTVIEQYEFITGDKCG